MPETRTAKLFKNGSSQAVRLPAEFRFEGDEVYATRDETTGDVVLSKNSGEENLWRTSSPCSRPSMSRRTSLLRGQ